MLTKLTILIVINGFVIIVNFHNRFHKALTEIFQFRRALVDCNKRTCSNESFWKRQDSGSGHFSGQDDDGRKEAEPGNPVNAEKVFFLTIHIDENN